MARVCQGVVVVVEMTSVAQLGPPWGLEKKQAKLPVEFRGGALANRAAQDCVFKARDRLSRKECACAALGNLASAGRLFATDAGLREAREVKVSPYSFTELDPYGYDYDEDREVQLSYEQYLDAWMSIVKESSIMAQRGSPSDEAVRFCCESCCHSWSFGVRREECQIYKDEEASLVVHYFSVAAEPEAFQKYVVLLGLIGVHLGKMYGLPRQSVWHQSILPFVMGCTSETDP